jgi:hypothetical protein
LYVVDFETVIHFVGQKVLLEFVLDFWRRHHCDRLANLVDPRPKVVPRIGLQVAQEDILTFSFGKDLVHFVPVNGAMVQLVKKHSEVYPS